MKFKTQYDVSDNACEVNDGKHNVEQEFISTTALVNSIVLPRGSRPFGMLNTKSLDEDALNRANDIPVNAVDTLSLAEQADFVLAQKAELERLQLQLKDVNSKIAEAKLKQDDVPPVVVSKDAPASK